MGLTLSPEVKMRQDGGRILLFPVNPGDSLFDPFFHFLNPPHAVILTLFDGKRDMTDIIRTVSYLFNMNRQEASNEVEKILSLKVNDTQTIGSLIIDANDIDHRKIRVYKPTDFIIPLEMIENSDVRCKIPSSVLVLPTMRCVTNCRYCYADRESFKGRKEFDLPLFKRLVKMMIECGIETVEFSGGDIFCRKDAFDMIKYTFSVGMYPSIPTKYPLSKNQISQLKAMGLSTIQISIDAINPDIIDWLVMRLGYGKKIIKTLNYLNEVGIQVRTNTVLTPHNIKDAINLIHYLAQLPNVFKIRSTCYSRSLYHHKDGLFSRLRDIYEFEKALNQIKVEFPDKGIFFSGPNVDPNESNETKRISNFSERAICTANRNSLVVLPDGRVTICEELYGNEHFIIGDLNEQTLMEIWNSQKALELAYPAQSSVPDGACKDCSDFNQCHLGLGRCVRETLKAYGNDRWYWPDPRCPRAPKGNQLAEQY